MTVIEKFESPAFHLEQTGTTEWTMFVHGNRELRTYQDETAAVRDMEYLVETCCDDYADLEIVDVVE
jgi:hypothetical protein